VFSGPPETSRVASAGLNHDAPQPVTPGRPSNGRTSIFVMEKAHLKPLTAAVSGKHPQTGSA